MYLCVQDSCPESFFFWFLVYAEHLDQYVQYTSDTIYICQKPQILSNTHLRRPVRDEVGRTSIGKSKVSYRVHRIFVFGFSFFSMMYGCDCVRPCVDGTTGVICTLMCISSRRLHTNHTMMRHLPAVAEILPCRSSRDSNFESRVYDPVGGRFI